ncbi:hypothetical protein J2D69_11215 [Lysinibacillus sphaericus]|uniref:Uncharacterized protein n=3 Tax=Lysinibacillus TaxID=400634 RepID=B1HZI5_LYSSC|nr:MULTISPECIES: hypothetical protein [Lysinibacillus]MBE5083280.1 hypothetical protein [Bacillus thuringiensis]ACA40282.1 hypothetical protein Bsph_2744 [Lysinibacillus sphaericus C3-41]AMO33675.1 hypothetical protein AR327_15145 [Lysinibacillus sphaericus]AMR91218.1 hypothetical protein A1T07_14065 [Lysinibacillus sphaericus]ANA45267.1 hypothetical protein A2J09_06730 [Lysinibacillus sphaericus]
MAIGVVVIALVLIVSIVFIICLGKSKKTTFIIWGITLMVVIAPLFAWLVSILYGIKEGDGFAAVGLMVILFPFLFLIGLVIFLVGVFKTF